jgi:hypothetical protein
MRSTNNLLVLLPLLLDLIALTTSKESTLIKLHLSKIQPSSMLKSLGYLCNISGKFDPKTVELVVTTYQVISLTTCLSVTIHLLCPRLFILQFCDVCGFSYGFISTHPMLSYFSTGFSIATFQFLR